MPGMLVGPFVGLVGVLLALQLINGLVFVGEGLMVAAGAFSALAAGQVLATASFLLALRLAPPTLVSVWLSFWVFNSVRLANFVRFFWFAKSPLALLPEEAAGQGEVEGAAGSK